MMPKSAKRFSDNIMLQIVRIGAVGLVEFGAILRNLWHSAKLNFAFTPYLPVVVLISAVFPKFRQFWCLASPS